MRKSNNPPILRGEQWKKAHPPESRRGGRPQNVIDIGTRFGKLVVIGRAEAKNRRSRSICRCDCGNEVVRTNSELKHGVKSCGCLLAESHLKHGGCRRGKRERLWIIYCGIKARCNNPRSKIYKYYGERGISVCKEWDADYAAFRTWAMDNGCKSGLTIDRINPNGNYEPSNCRWITQKEQCLNKRNTLKIKIGGTSKLVIEWCKEFGTPEKLARSRISEGKTGIDIFVPPYRKKGGAK